MKPYYEDGQCQIFLGDCREILPQLPKVDLVLTDPPYGIGIASKNLGGGRKDKTPSSPMIYGAWDVRVKDYIILHLLECGKNTILWGGQLLRQHPPAFAVLVDVG